MEQHIIYLLKLKLWEGSTEKVNIRKNWDGLNDSFNIKGLIGGRISVRVTHGMQFPFRKVQISIINRFRLKKQSLFENKESILYTQAQKTKNMHKKDMSQ